MRFFEIVTYSTTAAAEVAPLPSNIPSDTVSYIYNYAEGTWTCSPERLKRKVVCTIDAFMGCPNQLMKLLDISPVNIFETVEIVLNYEDWYRGRNVRDEAVLTFIRHDDHLTLKYQIVASVNNVKTGMIEHCDTQHLYLPPLDLLGIGTPHEPKAYPDVLFEKRPER